MTTQIVGFVAALAAMAVASQDRHQSFDIQVPQAPMRVISDGQPLVVYELHVTNFASEPLKILGLRALADGSGARIATWNPEELLARASIVGAPAQRRNELVLGPGERAILFIEIQLQRDAPTALRHELDYGLPDGSIATVSIDPVGVNSTQPTLLGPPLEGGPWVAVHDPSWPRGHRRVTYAMGGKVRLPGRFAVDWVATDNTGQLSHGDPDRPGDAIGYGADVLAGADAVVWAVRDALPESTSIRNNPAHTLGEGAGNYVVLHIGKDRYAFYEHLRPGSIRVRAGEHVRKGQVIGSLGFSGDTTGPHLHLHIADCGHTLQCEGVPFTLEGMDLLGRYDNIADLGKKAWNPAGARKPAGPEWPGCNVVVLFRQR